MPDELKEKKKTVGGLLEIERKYFRTGWVWEVET